MSLDCENDAYLLKLVPDLDVNHGNNSVIIPFSVFFDLFWPFGVAEQFLLCLNNLFATLVLLK